MSQLPLARGQHPADSTGKTSDIERMLREAIAHHQENRLDAAATHYSRILAIAPRHADALHLLGVVAMQLRRFAEAFELICKAIEISPQSAYFDSLGSTLFGWGKLAAAAESHQQAIALDSRNFRAHSNLGNVLYRMQLPAAAAASFRSAIALNPKLVDAQSNLGNVLRELGEVELAIEHCRKAIALNPAYGEAHNNLGNAVKMQGNLIEAIRCYREAQRLLPEEPQVALNLGITYRDLGDHDEAIANFKRAIQLRPAWGLAWSNFLFTLNFAADVTPADYLAQAMEFGRIASGEARPYSNWSIETASGAPVRVGFVSADLRAHPVGYFLESVLAHIDPARLQLYAYSTRPYDDALTARIKPRFAAWRSLAGLDDEAAARSIHDDGIQVLVDLSGHTDANRLPVFAWKPAPVQVSWIAYFASTGLATMDYVLGDKWVLPPEEAHHFVERPWRLPHGYLCFTLPYPPVPVDASPREAGQAAMFGYFGDLMKVNDRVAAVWAKILAGVPGSRLFLKAQQLGDARAREATIKRFGALNIGADRLVMEGASPRSDYLAAYNRVDLTLSPFPYPGGTTTAESLWMGVPVVCKRGDRFLGHLCESVLRSVGLDEWIADDEDDYAAKAIAFARGRSSHASLAVGLRERVLGSSLTDAPRFARSLEQAFTEMWAARNPE
jgi:predicted O-linked N-acetylglucosamine transferase (SPINDLY family)